MIGIWAGAFVLLGIGSHAVGWPLFVLALIPAWFAVGSGNPARRLILLICLSGLAAIGLVRAAVVPAIPPVVGYGETERLEGRVVSPVQTDLRYQHLDVELERFRTGGDWSAGTGRVRVVAPFSPAIHYGDRVGMTGELTPAEDEDAGYRSYLGQQRISGSVFARSIWVEAPGSGIRRLLFGFGAELSDRLRRVAPGEPGILLSGLVVGDDRALSGETANDFRRTGMSHITAVSGSNLALVVVLLMAAGNPLGMRRRLGWLLATAVAVWLYAIVTGLDPPVVRAALMATISLMAPVFGRRADYLTAAVLSAALMALVEPGLLANIGFQLSLSASVALAALASGMSVTTPGGAVRLAIDGAITAQIATLPITLVTFGAFSWVSIPVNIVVGPLVAVAFPLAFAGSLLEPVNRPVGDAIMSVAGGIAEAILGLVRRFADLPGASEQIPEVPVGARALVILLALVAVLGVSRAGRRWSDRLVRRMWPVSTAMRTGRSR